MRSKLRVLLLGVAAVVVAGCGGGGGGGGPVITSPPAGASPNAPVGLAVNATLDDYFITMSTEAVTAPFTISVVNEGAGPHGFSIEDADKQLIATTGEILRAKTGQLVVPELAAGSYSYFCPVIGHKRDGMVGTLTVQ